MYTDVQKMQIALFSDLVGRPLPPSVRDELAAGIAARGNAQLAIGTLPAPQAEAAAALLGQGLKLSNELGKLGQRGVSAIFAGEHPIEWLAGYFTHRPALLFAVGNKGLLDLQDTPVFLTLAAFRKAGCNGIFLADRPVDSALRNNDVSSALRASRGLLLSDMVHMRASTATLQAAGTSAPGTAAERGATTGDNAAPEFAADKLLRVDGSNAPSAVGRSQKHVFISGSRSQKAIPQNVQKSLGAIIEQDIGIFIGDSDKGVDNEIIDFLRAPLYRNVTLFTISPRPRVAAEDAWKIRTVEADGSLKPQQRQMAKDRAMADEADWGLALLNPIEKNRFGSLQVSAGTLRNVVQLLLQGKPVKLFYLYENQVTSRNLGAIGDLEEVIGSYRHERLGQAERDAALSSKGVAPDADAAEVRYEKIMAKYRSLRKAEEKILAKDRESAGAESPAQQTLPLFDA